MKRINLGLLVIGMCLGSGQLLAQDGRVSSAAWKLQDTKETPNFHQLVLSGIRDWNNGWSIAIEGEPRVADRYRALSRDGDVRTGNVTLPGAAETRLRHAAVAVDGSIVVTGYATMRNGSGEYFIARIRADGSVSDSVQTGPFASQCICPAPDGSVWALGSELRAEEEGENHTVLRHFDFGKGLIGQALDSRTFSRSWTREITRWAAGDADSSWLRCDSKRAYVYSNPSDELFEVDARTHRVSRWPIDFDAAGKPVALAVTRSGDLFANLVPADDPTNGSPFVNLFVLEKDNARSRARWVMVGQRLEQEEEDATSRNLRKQPGVRGLFLWGADGERLVLEEMKGQPWGTMVRWTEVTRFSQKEARQ